MTGYRKGGRRQRGEKRRKRNGRKGIEMKEKKKEKLKEREGIETGIGKKRRNFRVSIDRGREG